MFLSLTELTLLIELTLDPNVILAISTIVLVAVTAYYARQTNLLVKETNRMVEETKQESRRRELLLLTKEIYRPLYEATKEIEQGIKESLGANKGRIVEITKTYWYDFVVDEVRIAVEGYIGLVDSYTHEMERVQGVIAETTKLLFKKMLDEYVPAGRRSVILAQINSELYMINRGLGFEKLRTGKAEDGIFHWFNNFMTDEEDRGFKEQVIKGVAKKLVQALHANNEFDKISSLRSDAITKTQQLLRLLTEQSKEIVT